MAFLRTLALGFVVASAASAQNISSPAAVSGSSNSSTVPTPTVSSNVTLVPATATASWNPDWTMQTSVPYVMQNVSTEGLPEMDWNLSMQDAVTKQLLCNQQESWCSKAGCEDPEAEVEDNFCVPETMATRCTCSKGKSLLAEYNWPVSSNDCSLRNTMCVSACKNVRVTKVEDRSSCIDNCNKTFRATCGMPGQFAASYAVKKKSDTPNYKLVQGGDSTDAAFNLQAPATFAVVAVVAVVALLA